MKQIFKFFFTIAIFTLFIANSGFAQVGIGFYTGLSTPNDKINDVYNKSTIGDYNRLLESTKLGYHLGAKLRFPMSEQLLFTGGIAWHNFPQSEIVLKVPGEEDVILNTTQNVFPISAAVNYYLINSIIGIYGTGELTYNYISNTVNIVKKGVNIPLNLDKSPMDSRVGFGLGAGIDLDIKVVMLNIEAKYNILNLIGRTGDEQTKAYFSLSLGAYFGSSSPKK